MPTGRPAQDPVDIAVDACTRFAAHLMLLSHQLGEHGLEILSALGIHEMILLTNTHHTPVALGGYGLTLVGERPIPGDE